MFTQQQHMALMEKYADELVAGFIQTRGGDLNKVTAQMARAVAANAAASPSQPWPLAGGTIGPDDSGVG